MVDWHFYFGFEEKEHQYLYSSLKADDVVFDVGANIGLVAIQLADKVQKGKVYAFEPFIENFERMKENLSFNDIENLNPFNLGFSEGEEEVSFFAPEAKNSGMVSVNPSKLGETHLTTLDIFIENNAIDRLSLIKLDVEGYEQKVLRGAKNTLDSFRPKLFVELNHRHLKRYGDSASGLVALIESHGYRCTNCSNGQALTSDMELDLLQTDIFAEPR
jgi:FkbM family methyltransferase